MFITTLEEKFHAFLSKLYLSEKKLLEVRKEVSRQATDEQLRGILQNNLLNSQQRIKNLEASFQLLNLKPVPAPSQHVNGLAAEGRELLLASTDNPILLDCVIVEFQSTIERIQTACHREVIMAAQWLGHAHVVQLLEQNLQEEEDATDALESLAPKLFEKLANDTPNGTRRTGTSAP